MTAPLAADRGPVVPAAVLFDDDGWSLRLTEYGSDSRPRCGNCEVAEHGTAGRRWYL